MVNFELEEVVGLFNKQPAEFLGTLKTEDGEWKSKDEILTAIRKADKDRLDVVVKGESGKAVRLRMKQAQNYIKENFGVESDANEIEDHLKLLVESLQGKAVKERIVEKLVDLTEETALQNPIVKSLLKSEVAKNSTELQGKLAESEKKFREYLDDVNRKKLDSQLIKWAEKALTDVKADLKKDVQERQKQLRRFVNGMKADFKFKPAEDEDAAPIVLGADGEPLQEGYVDITYTDLVKRENIFRVLEYDQDKSSPGATSQAASPTQRQSVTVPKTVAEYTAALAAEKDSDKKRLIMEAFNAAQEKK